MTTTMTRADEDEDEAQSIQLTPLVLVHSVQFVIEPSN